MKVELRQSTPHPEEAQFKLADDGEFLSEFRTGLEIEPAIGKHADDYLDALSAHVSLEDPRLSLFVDRLIKVIPTLGVLYVLFPPAAISTIYNIISTEIARYPENYLNPVLYPRYYLACLVGYIALGISASIDLSIVVVAFSSLLGNLSDILSEIERGRALDGTSPGEEEIKSKIVILGQEEGLLPYRLFDPKDPQFTKQENRFVKKQLRESRKIRNKEEKERIETEKAEARRLQKEQERVKMEEKISQLVEFRNQVIPEESNLR